MEKYFVFLDGLRESGKTNMLGAIPYLQAGFPELTFDRKRASEVLSAWMKTRSEGKGKNA